MNLNSVQERNPTTLSLLYVVEIAYQHLSEIS